MDSRGLKKDLAGILKRNIETRKKAFKTLEGQGVPKVLINGEWCYYCRDRYSEYWINSEGAIVKIERTAPKRV